MATGRARRGNHPGHHAHSPRRLTLPRHRKLLLEPLEQRTLLDGMGVHEDFYSVSAEAALDVGPVNGTFETGDLTGWTTFATPGGTLGGAGFPDVVGFDIDGDGVQTESLQLLVGDGGGGIHQSVQLAAGDVTITVDVAAKSLSADAEGGLFELLVDDVVVGSHDFGAIGTDTTERAQLNAALTDVTEGEHEIRVRVTRSGPNSYGSSPFSFVDNVLVHGNAAGVLSNDAGSEAELLNSLLVTATQDGGLELRPDGSFRYVPDAAFTGEDSFVYRAVEPGEGLTLYTVDAVNDKLVKLDSGTGQLAIVGAIDHDMHTVDLTYDAGILYALNVGGGTYELVSIDPATGQKIAVVPITKPGATLTAMKGITAVDGSLYVVHAEESAYCGAACGAAHILARLNAETGIISSLVNYRSLDGGFNHDFHAISTDAEGRIVSSRLYWESISVWYLGVDPASISFLRRSYPPDARVNDTTTAGSSYYVLNPSFHRLHRIDPVNPGYGSTVENVSLPPLGEQSQRTGLCPRL